MGPSRKTLLALAQTRFEEDDLAIMSEQLPQILEPVGSLVRVGAQRTEVIPTNEQTTAAMLRMGVKIGEHDLQDAATIGAHVQGIGVLRVFRGRALVHQQRLTNVIGSLMATIKK